MSTQETVSFLLETIFDEGPRKVSLRVSVRRSDASAPPPITPNSIIKLLEQRGYAQYFRFDDSISIIVDDLTKRLKALNSGSKLYEDSYETPAIAEAHDAIGLVEISEDALEVYLTITPAKGGVQLDLDSATSILKNAGVKYGIEKQFLMQLLQQASQSETGDDIKMLVAKAKAPVNGEDTQFIAMVETASERILKPQLRPDGTIDMRELGNLPIVKAKQKIMTKKLFTLGQPGIDTLGNPIEAEPGEDFDFELSPGSMINPENNKELVAEFNGQPNLVHNGMKVENVVKVKAVDLSTGNLDIDANLLVEGDITECMTVKCSGDITVGGVIESATVEAKGSIIVGKGIVGQLPKHIGEKTELSTFVRAGKNINAVFASYSKLEAGEELHMDEQMLHCDANSHGSVTIGNEKTVGSQIVGGITKAALTIETDIVGSHAGILTQFDLSGPYQSNQKDIMSLEHDIENKNEQVTALKNSYGKFTQLESTPERIQQSNKIKNTILHLTKEIDELELENQSKREHRDKKLQQMQLKVKRQVQPPVEVKIGARKFRSTRTMESGVISFFDGEVRFQAENLDRKNKKGS